jgi:hypothetical protein
VVRQAAISSINKRARGSPYLGGFRNSALALSDICEELHRWHCGKMSALTWRRVIQVDDRLGALFGFSVREDELLDRLVRCFREIKDTSQIIPWREVIRCD